MHALYPETMTADTAAALREGVSTGDVRAVQRAVDNRAAAVQEIVTSIQTRAAARTSGSGGATRYRSFGGGRSGGGGGGRW
jgi:hypothetical protein